MGNRLRVFLRPLEHAIPAKSIQVDFFYDYTRILSELRGGAHVVGDVSGACERPGGPR